MNNINLLISIILTINMLIGDAGNMQVLSFDSKKELKKYMKSISKDLGVKCSFCHDMNDKSLDTKHKIIARDMIIMQNNLNRQFFGQMGDSLSHNQNTLQISCWTCHRGSKIPELNRPSK